MAFLVNRDELDFCRNKVMLESVLKTIHSWCFDTPLTINGEEFEGIAIEFALKYIESPETILLILKENKQKIMYGVADNKNEKPNSWSPEDYYNYLYKTIRVLYYLTDTSNCLWLNNDESFYNDYIKESDNELSGVDFIVLSALNDEINIFNSKEILNEYFNKVNTLEVFKETLMKYISDYISNEETKVNLMNRLFEIWDKEIEENPEEFEEDENKLCSYRSLMYDIFSPEHILWDLKEYLGADYLFLK